MIDGDLWLKFRIFILAWVHQRVHGKECGAYVLVFFLVFFLDVAGFVDVVRIWRGGEELGQM